MSEKPQDKPPALTAPLSRRGFLRGAAVGAVAGVGLLQEACATPAAEQASAPLPTPAPYPVAAGGPADATLRVSSAALEPDAITRSACQFCNALCGLEVGTKQGRVLSIAPLLGDPVQAGALCVKAELMPQLVHNHHRLTRPLKRVGGAKGDPDSRFEPVSWDEALDLIAERLLTLRDAGQAHTIANRTSGRMLRGVGSLVHRFFTLLGSPNDTDVGPVCNDAGGDALAWTFGLGNFTNGYGVDPATGQEDLGAARCLFFLGTNQAETHPVTFKHLLRERERTGAQLIVVDPRKTTTAAQADLWLPIKPHTDMALILGMLGHIVRTGLHDAAFVGRWTVGFEALAAHLEEQGATPEWAAKVCDIDAALIRRAAEAYAKARPAAIFCNAGISHQLGAFDTYRTLTFLASVTGNVGVPGGGCNFMHNTWPGGLALPPLEGAPPAINQPALPVGPDSFADAILLGRPYKLRALLTAGNPLLSSARSSRVREAFKALEFYVYTGLFMEESARYADVILPVRSGLETEGVYMRRDDRGIRWQDAAVAPVGESRTDVEIWVELAHRMAQKDKLNSSLRCGANFPRAWLDYKQLWATFDRLTPGMGGMSVERLRQRVEPLRWPCPSPSHPGVSTLYLDHPSWYAALEALDPKHRGKRFPTPSGKIELTTPEIEAKLAAAGHHALPTFYTHPEVTGRNPSIRYTDTMVPNPLHPGALTPKVVLGEPSSPGDRAAFPLMGMIGRSSVAHFAGMTHWTWTGKQLDGVRLVQLHPRTAKALGITDGAPIIVESPRGAIQGTALLWEELREDTIFVPNGFGEAQAVGDMVGAPRYETAANALVDDRYFDNLSGQQAYKCFACRVRPG